MRHSNVDQYASITSFFKFDPRIKIVSILIFVILISLIRDMIILLMAFIFIISLILISQVPIKHITKRYLIAMPFIFFAAFTMLVYQGFLMFFIMFIRITSCVLALLLISCTTPFFDILKGLQSMKLPGILVILLMFTYRYFFVFVEESHRMKMARKSKGFTGGKHILDKIGMRTISYTAGMILIRAYQRGIRIYDALQVRGFTGMVKTLTPLKITILDIFFFTVLVFTGSLFFYYDWIVIGWY